MAHRKRLTITMRRDLLAQIDHMISNSDARNRSHAIESIVGEKFGNTYARYAIILGGGEGILIDGKNTSPLLAQHNGKRLIEHHIKKLADVGIEQVILSVGSFGDDVRSIVGDGAQYDVKIIYFENDYGTASALRQARDLLKDTFVMLNGHVVMEDINLEDIIIAHKNKRAMATIALTTVSVPDDFGQVKMRGTDVVQYLEKPGAGKSISHIVNAGIYIIEPAVCALVKPEEESIEKNIFPLLCQQGMLSGYVLDTEWNRLTP